MATTPRAAQKGRLIGLYSHKPQQGKSTVAHLMLDEWLMRSNRGLVRSFATPLKLAGAAYLEQMGLSDQDATRAVFEDKDKPIPALNGILGRDILCLVGEWARDHVGPDIWVNKAMRDADGYLTGGTRIVIDDVRRPNEAQAVLDRGGVLVKVTRNPEGVADDVTTTDTEGNLEKMPFAAVIFNSGTLAQLRNKVKIIVRGLGR